MSSILKALKKLEQEKARGREGSVDIARDILRGGSRRKSGPSWLFPALAAAVMLALVVAAVVGLGGRRERSPEPPAAMTPAAPSVMVTPPVSASDPPVQEVRLQPFPEPVRPAAEPQLKAEPKVALPAAPAVAQPAPARKAAPEVMVEPTAAVAVPETSPVTAPSPAPALVPDHAEQPPARPRLAVSAIAYQEGREDRLAVVNDLPVMEGTLLEGAKVEEILPDRVRFSWQGRSIEVPIGAQ